MPQRRRGRARRPGDATFEPNLTPLLDVVLQLITFFMMLVHFGTQVDGDARSVRLPVAPAALPTGTLTLERLVVVLGADGTLLAGDGLARDPGAAAAWWRDQARQRRPTGADGPAAELPTVVVVRADRAATYGTIRRALAAAQAQGFARFALAVEREPAS